MLIQKRILVIDDEPEFVDMVKMRLEANDYLVLSAGDGIEGLRKAQEEEGIDLILLDVMMPGKDGFAVLSELKRDRRTRRIPVVMLTAKGESRAIFESQNRGAVDYIIKPFESQDLLDVLKRHA